MAKALKPLDQAESSFLLNPVFSTEAILIRTHRLTETSLIVSWFTQTEGLVKTVAKGALRPKNPFSGKLDLFFSGEISVVRARKGELHILKEVAISEWREGLRKQYLTTLMAGYFCQLVEATVEPESCEPEMFSLLKRALNFLEKEEPSMRALLFFESQLENLLGISGGHGTAEAALRHHIGTIPAARAQILERLETS